MGYRATCSTTLCRLDYIRSETTSKPWDKAPDSMSVGLAWGSSCPLRLCRQKHTTLRPMHLRRCFVTSVPQSGQMALSAVSNVVQL